MPQLDTSEKLDAMQIRMQAVRDSLGYDVDEFVDSTKTLTDWKYYVKSYPWACMGAGLAVGYILMPARKEIISPDPDTIAKLAKKNKLVIKMNPPVQKRGGLTGAVVGLASTLLVRGLTSYAGNQLGKFSGSIAAKEPFNPKTTQAFGDPVSPP